MKYVLVTGACGGMGKAAVQMLSNAGYTVFAMDKKPIPAQKNVIPVVADVTDGASLEAAFDQIRKITASLYAIVHFAGIYVLDSLVEIPEDTFHRVFDVNVFGAYRVNKVFLPLLHEGSRIVLTTSELAPLDPLPFTGLYAITKSTLDKYAYSLRMELQLLGISVTVLRPGAVQTDMLRISTDGLDCFCDQTKLYSCNAKRFRQIVAGIEARNVPPAAVGEKICRILRSRRPKYVYSLNRNPLLLMMNILPSRWQTRIIGMILK